MCVVKELFFPKNHDHLSVNSVSPAGHTSSVHPGITFVYSLGIGISGVDHPRCIFRCGTINVFRDALPGVFRGLLKCEDMLLQRNGWLNDNGELQVQAEIRGLPSFQPSPVPGLAGHQWPCTQKSHGSTKMSQLRCSLFGGLVVG